MTEGAEPTMAVGLMSEAKQALQSDGRVRVTLKYEPGAPANLHQLGVIAVQTEKLLKEIARNIDPKCRISVHLTDVGFVPGDALTIGLQVVDVTKAARKRKGAEHE